LPKANSAPRPKDRTNLEIYELVEQQVLPRLDKLERTVTNSGLNGYSADFKQMVEEYRATAKVQENWAGVKADLGRRLGFLRFPRAWLRVIFYAILGGIGWQIVVGLNAHPVHLG
jgi:hypothetical protein